METISHLNVNIEGIEFAKLIDFEISHKINEHAVAVIKGEVDADKAMKIAQRIDEKIKVKITTTAEGQPNILYVGVVTNVAVENISDYAVLTVYCKSYSYLSDIEKEYKSYQNTTRTHEYILNAALQGKAIVSMEIADSAIGKMIVQCNETDWEFSKRIASMLGVSIITSINSQVPVFYLGFPANQKSVYLPYAELLSDEDENSTCIKTNQYMFLGTEVVCCDTIYRVKYIKTSFEKGVLIATVGLGTKRNFEQKQIGNANITGKIYIGEVKDVKRDKVKVHLVDIDAVYDATTNVWLPYSTTYSSADGSGFYCMPAKGDRVRVFFPGIDEGGAFVASSESKNPAGKTTHKQWMGPGGKKLLMTEEGIYITGGNANTSIFINLTDASGITISSDNNITICAKNNLSLISNNNVSITAENDILISSAESYIDITPKGIEVGAENIVIK